MYLQKHKPLKKLQTYCILNFAQNIDNSGKRNGKLCTNALLDKFDKITPSSGYIWRPDSESTIPFIFLRSSGLLAPTSLSNCSPSFRKKNVGVAFISHCVLNSCIITQTIMGHVPTRNFTFKEL